MNRRLKTNAPPPAEPVAAALLPGAAFADAHRQQMAVAGEAAGVMFRGAEAIRQIQERAAVETAQRHSAHARQFSSAADPAELMLAHAKLLREDLDAAARCWQEMAATALETQFEIAACCTHLVDSQAALEAAAAFGP